MNFVLICFWTLMIFASIIWYAVLLFYVGAKGGREIIRMTQKLEQRLQEDDGPAEPAAQADHAL
ncbi:MAG: hypothetical protein HQ567_20515 [Candidatus Nealsonbacteria bacterium]|nr:hypothetical protein [Candidatus Nealsonbacteria bacterium]